MHVRWRDKFDATVILRKFSEIIKVSDNSQSISFTGIKYYQYLSILHTMILLDENISPEVGKSLISKGFLNAAKKNKFTKPAVLYEINKEIEKHIAKPNQKYFILTTLNINVTGNIPNHTINGCHLRFCKELPRKFLKARKNALDHVSQWLIDADEGSHYFVIAHSTAKTDIEAGNNALDAINLLRGIWNLLLNPDMVFYIGRSKPVNKITIGAFHTLHENNGSWNKSIYWYQPDYFKKNDIVNLSYTGDKTLKNTLRIRNKLKYLNYRKDIENAIIRYSKALDSVDYNASIIELWSVLETLTDTLKSNYDKTIKRIVFLYNERDYHSQVLEHLRQYRNNNVHVGIGQSDVLTLVYQLKGYVEFILFLHIENPFKFKSLSEAGDFMDLNPNIDLLKKKILLYQRGINFLSKKP